MNDRLADGMAGGVPGGLPGPAPGRAGADPSRPDLASVLAAAGTQCRVIRALMLRESRSRYGEHKLGFLWALLEPLLMVALFVTIFSAMRADSIANMALVPFVITGIVPFSLFKDTFGQMQNAVTSNRSLLGFPQVTTFDVIVARGLLDVAIILCVFVIVLSLARVFGFDWRCEDPLGVLAVCGLIVLLGMGMGFLFASLSPIVPSLKQVGSLLFGRPLFLTSGLFFVADSVPHPVREWLLWNPLLHMMELLRDRFFFEFVTPHGSWSYAVTVSVVVFAIGLLVHQAVHRRAVVGL